MLNDIEILKHVKGKTVEEAIRLCKENKFRFRVIKEDDRCLIITMDCWMNRVSAEVENGIVIKCNIG